MNAILDGYAAGAGQGLIERFESLSTSELFAPVAELLPKTPDTVADVGAGTGRDAAWFADQGHAVLAIEPVEALRSAGLRLHRSARIEWLDDRLPNLSASQAKAPFGLVTLCGVWQHLDDQDRAIAIRNIGRMTRDGGLVVMSLRHGPGAPDRPVYPVSVEATIAAASGCSLRLMRRTEAASVQPGNRAAGVHWTWLALQKS